jgi:iron complex outermembrane receptor protein
VAQGETIVARQVPGGSMTAKGVEVEMNWQVTDAFNLSAALSLLDAELDDFSRTVSNRVFRAGGDEEIGSGPPGDSNNSQVYYLSGQAARFSPDWTLAVDASYAFDLGGMGRLVPGVYIYASDSYKTTNVPYFFTYQSSYTTVDLRMTWYQSQGPWSAQAYMTNATDETIQIGGDQFSEGRAVADFNAPRRWGVAVRYNF